MPPADAAAPEGPVAARMRATLEAEFSPVLLEVRDDSERHRGHGGWREGGETHFHLRMVSAVFDGLSRVERQRRVNKALAAELADRVHALTMHLKGAAE